MAGERADGDARAGDRRTAAEARERVNVAIRLVRYEGYKAAGIHAVVDAAAVALVINLALTVLGLPLPGPENTRQAVAVAVGLLAGLVEFVARVRVPLVERFEEVNPEVREALRTARDAARAGAETRVAARLYEDVLAGLREASSSDLVSTRRIAGTVVLVMVLSAVTVQASVVGIDLTDSPVDEDVPEDERENEYGGLEDGDDILGEETDVGNGSDDLDAVVGGSGGGGDSGESTDRTYNSGGFSATGSYDAQQSGFAPSDEVENADIIREYSVRIRDEDS